MRALLSLLLFFPITALASPDDSSNLKGWKYLIDKLEQDGFDRKKIEKIYLNKKMPPVDEVYFKLKPREADSIYQGFRSKALISKAHDFLDRYEGVFDSAEKVYEVPRYVIAAILLVETNLGTNTGNHMIIERLSRVGSIAKPENIEANYKKHLGENPKVERKEVEARAKYLEERFYPEVKALLKLADEQKVNVLNIKGSFAGAFGYPQFLPSTFVNHAVDADANGVTSLFNVSDSIFSIANYLKHSGWKNNSTKKEKEAVIWEYNHSEPYIDTVLYIAEELEKKQDTDE